MEDIILPQIKCEILDEQEPINPLDVSSPVFEASFIETDNKTLKYKCPMCNKKFKSKEKVQRHVNTHITIHSIYANGDFKCSECNSYFDTTENFQLHIETHKKSRGRPRKESASSDDDIKPYICDKCAKGFKRKQQLLIHSLIHNDIKPFRCDLCEKCFRLKQQLQNHSKVHEDVRPFTCDSCEKSFKFKQQLENHTKTHTDIRPFSCLFCEKAFKFKQQLQNHYRVHDDLRLFKCDFCDKAFKLKQQLQFHNRVHSDERPFQCFSCEKSFKFKQQLNNHYKVHGKMFIESSIFEPNINLETMDVSCSSLNGNEKQKSGVKANLDNDNLKTNNDLNEDSVLNFKGQIKKNKITPPPVTTTHISNIEKELNDDLIPSGESMEQNGKNDNLAMEINTENENSPVKQTHLEKDSTSNFEDQMNINTQNSKSIEHEAIECKKLSADVTLAMEIKSENESNRVKPTHLEKNSTLNFKKQINIDSPSESIDHKIVEQEKSATDVELAMEIHSENKNNHVEQTHLEKDSTSNLEEQMNIDAPTGARSIEHEVIEREKLAAVVPLAMEINSEKTHLEKNSTLNFKKPVNIDTPSESIAHKTVKTRKIGRGCKRSKVKTF